MQRTAQQYRLLEPAIYQRFARQDDQATPKRLWLLTFLFVFYSTLLGEILLGLDGFAIALVIAFLLRLLLS